MTKGQKAIGNKEVWLEYRSVHTKWITVQSSRGLTEQGELIRLNELRMKRVKLILHHLHPGELEEKQTEI